MSSQATMTTAKPRARRSDAGAVRCSARDVELLRIVGEQYAVTLPQLARLMDCSSHAARWLRSRWERAGWARGRAVLVDEPVFVWLTRRGHGIAGLDYSVWRPNPGMLAHAQDALEAAASRCSSSAATSPTTRS
jgi:DNA-binding CsgD family transcriptional regulator